MNSAAIVSAYSGSSLVGSTSLLASINTTAPPDVTTTGSNASTSLSVSSVSTAVNSTFIVKNNGSDTLAVSGNTGTIRFGGQNCSSHTTGSPCAINTGSSRVYTVIAQGTIRIGSTTLTIGSGGGGGGGTSAGGASTSATSAPQAVTVSLTPTDGTTCANSSQSATQGTWLALPGANDCTPPKSKPGAKLLGWATSPDFPVVLAQRQVTNGWAAYETFNGSGEITSVFIPAGGETFVSGSTSLYPIWAS